MRLAEAASWRSLIDPLRSLLMTAYLINQLRQPGVLHREVLDAV
jgi:hypothetical protein